jgi:hypothetical protein
MAPLSAMEISTETPDIAPVAFARSAAVGAAVRVGMWSARAARLIDACGCAAGTACRTAALLAAVRRSHPLLALSPAQISRWTALVVGACVLSRRPSSPATERPGPITIGSGAVLRHACGPIARDTSGMRVADGAFGWRSIGGDTINSFDAHEAHGPLLTTRVPPPGSVAQVRLEPAWPDRVAVAHTRPRARVVESYRLDPDQFANLRPPTLPLEGEVSPPFLRPRSQPCTRPRRQLVVIRPGARCDTNRAASIHRRGSQIPQANRTDVACAREHQSHHAG